MIFRTNELQTNGFFVYWERKVFWKYNGIIEGINSYSKEKNVQNNNHFRDGLNLNKLKTFFDLLMFGIILAVFVFIIEILIVFKIKNFNIVLKLKHKFTLT